MSGVVGSTEPAGVGSTEPAAAEVPALPAPEQQK
jgi:hypothetical protein